MLFNCAFCLIEIVTKSCVCTGVIKTRDANPTVPMVVAEFLYEAGPDRGYAGSCCGGCHQGCGPHEDNHGYQCPANATDSAAKRMIMWCALSSALLLTCPFPFFCFVFHTVVA